MEAVLYASNGGTLVLVPDCFEPSSDLVQAHGRFRPCGRVRITEPCHIELCRRISADFDHSSYSILGTRDARELFGSQIPCASSDRRRQPREVQLSCRQPELLRRTPGRAAKARPAAKIDRIAAACASIGAIVTQTGTPVREFVRFMRMAASLSTAGIRPSDAYAPEPADCATSREL